MKNYDRNQPLIVIHVPKAAGNTTQKIFQNWFGDGFLRHYFDEQEGAMPPKYNIFNMHSSEKPILLYGHFNKSRGFGAEDYYPDIKQFITILRDPFELTVSSYFYTRKTGSNWKDQSRAPKGKVQEFLLNAKPNMLNHFPREITFHNYRDIIEEYFIEVGITEYLDESMHRIAKKLDMPYDPTSLGHYNATERDQEVSGYLKDLFIEKNPLEFAVYHYVLAKFTQQDAPPGRYFTDVP